MPQLPAIMARTILKHNGMRSWTFCSNHSAQPRRPQRSDVENPWKSDTLQNAGANPKPFLGPKGYTGYTWDNYLCWFPAAWVCGGAGMVLLCKFWRLRLVAIHSSSLRVRRVKGHLESMVQSWLLLLLPLNEETRQHLYLGSSGNGLYPKNNSLTYV